MRTVTSLLQRRFTQAIRRTLSVPYFPESQLRSTFTFLCTQTPNNVTEKILESKQAEPRSCLSYRIEKLPKDEPVRSAFQSWMGDGFPIHRGDIFHAINRLRKLKLNKRALEVTLSLPIYFVCVKPVVVLNLIMGWMKQVFSGLFRLWM